MQRHHCGGLPQPTTTLSTCWSRQASAVVGDRNDDGLHPAVPARGDGPGGAARAPARGDRADVELLYVPQAASLNGAGRMAWT